MTQKEKDVVSVNQPVIEISKIFHEHQVKQKNDHEGHQSHNVPLTEVFKQTSKGHALFRRTEWKIR